jgi:hypothetical protein
MSVGAGSNLYAGGGRIRTLSKALPQVKHVKRRQRATLLHRGAGVKKIN